MGRIHVHDWIYCRPCGQEFFYKVKELWNDKVFKKGKWESFESTTINKYYWLHEYAYEEYPSYYNNHPDFDNILKYLTANIDVQWKWQDDNYQFFVASLTIEAKLWHYFFFS